MNIQKCARRILRKIGKISLASVTTYLQKEKGYRVLYVGTPSGDDAIYKHDLQSYVKRKAFTYSDKSKFVFLHDEYNYDDKLSLLLHELGHIELGHLSAVYEPDSVNMERYAEVFAYFMQHPPKSTFLKILISIITTASLCFGAFALLPNSVQQNKDNAITVNATYEGFGEAIPIDENTNYVYVAPTGEKYHTANCRYASLSSKRIPLEEAQEEYSPCSICKPDNN